MRADFFIRKSTERDYEALCEIYEETDSLHAEALPHVFRKADRPARSRDLILGVIANENSALFVAESGERIIGFIHVLIQEARDIPILVSRRYAHIGELVVKREFRRTRVGRGLVEKAHRWALDKGITEIELNVWEFNGGAIAFYEELGYGTASRKMWKSLRE